MLRVRSLEGNRQWLDGGAMFGNVPRALWSRWCRPDDRGRIELACRALLVDEGDRRVLLETGIGAFLPPKLKERYGVFEPEHALLRSLTRAGLDEGDIDVVCLSHLHFDHAGGLLSEWREGADPELLFPRARFIVTKTAFERAASPHDRDRASFIPVLPDLLRESGRLDLVSREDFPGLLGSRYEFRETFGHTPGMLHATVRGEASAVFFCADLVPGAAWVHLPITMGYDRSAEQLVDEKRAVYRDLLADRPPPWLFFVHDSRNAVAMLSRDESGRFSAVRSKPDFGSGWDLDAGPPDR